MTNCDVYRHPMSTFRLWHAISWKRSPLARSKVFASQRKNQISSGSSRFWNPAQKWSFSNIKGLNSPKSIPGDCANWQFAGLIQAMRTSINPDLGFTLELFPPFLSSVATMLRGCITRRLLWNVHMKNCTSNRLDIAKKALVLAKDCLRYFQLDQRSGLRWGIFLMQR